MSHSLAQTGGAKAWALNARGGPLARFSLWVAVSRYGINP